MGARRPATGDINLMTSIPPRRSPSISAAPSPTSPCWITAAARSGTPRRRRRRQDPSIAFMTGIAEALALGKLGPAALGHVFHGTTVATNLILEGKGAKAALLTTEGFKHVLEIGRHDIPRKANMYSWIKPRAAGAAGAHPRDRAAGSIPAAARSRRSTSQRCARPRAPSRRRASTPIAICFLHAYADGRHERRARAILLEEIPGAPVSISSEVLPVFREYERSMATILNVYVMPAVSTYLGAAGAAPRGAPRAGPAAADEVERRRRRRRHHAPRARADRALGPRRRRHGRGLRRRARGLQEPHHHRYRRHLGGHLPDQERRAAHDRRGQGGRVAAQPADDRHQHHRRRRRLDRPGERRGRAHGGAGERRRAAGPGLLRPRRHRAHGDRRESGAGPADAGAARRPSRPRPRRRRACDRRARRPAPRPRSRPRRPRHPLHHRQQHGGGDPRGLGGARPRSPRLRAVALRRRRAAARHVARAPSRHQDHPGAALAGRALGDGAAGGEREIGIRPHVPAAAAALRPRRHGPGLRRAAGPSRGLARP